MNLRTASLFALIGTILAAVLAIGRFILYVVQSLGGLVAPSSVLTALVQAIVWTALAVFFFVFYRKQA